MTPDELIAEYRKQAIIHGECAETGNARRGNKAYDALMRVRRELRRGGHEYARKIILDLVDDESPYVRLKAATDALRLSPEHGERVLSELAQGPRSMLRFEAETTLAYWKKGEFEARWWDD